MNTATGMPDMTPELKEKAASAKGRAFAIIGPAIFELFGLGFAALIYNFGDTVKYDSKIAMVNELDLQWVYLAAFFFAVLV